MDIKDNFANNLCEYRKQFKLTQVGLAEKLNYSDKAISKWERGEAIPDAYTLKQIADFFGVKIDTLLSDHSDLKTKLLPSLRNLPKKRTMKSLIYMAIVWAVAILSFVTVNILTNLSYTWLLFIYALPITCLILVILTSVWKKSLFNVIILSFMIWTTILSIFLSLTLFADAPSNVWEIFLIGIPVNAFFIFRYIYNKVK